ncbi:hypothetical protein [Longispora albida]|uniref:hypothetical protein n=1 Tax=Longispora albida TaxID=203523 RepID=UPI000370C2E5|nr:hypothetical protein [Longispora albida]
MTGKEPQVERHEINARAERSGKWWAVMAVTPEGHEIHTQARRLSQVEAMVRDAVALACEWPEETIGVQVEIVLPESFTVEIAQARSLREQAEETNRRAAEAMRKVTHHLAEEGFSLAEIAMTLGVSKARAQQLAAV